MHEQQNAKLKYKIYSSSGFRIYQSYEGAYTLDAWLNKYSNNIDSYWLNGDIIYWQSNYDRLKALLKPVNIDIENLDSLSERRKWWKPWLKSVKVCLFERDLFRYVYLREFCLRCVFERVWFRYVCLRVFCLGM